MISLKKTENKKWGVYVNGEFSAHILLNKQNSIRMYRKIMADVGSYDSPKFDIELSNIQDGVKCVVWKVRDDKEVFSRSYWFVDFDEVV